MAIFFNKVQKVDPSNPEAPRKWYAVLKTLGQKSEKEMAQLLADETTLNPKEAEMAFAQFGKVIVRTVLDGYSGQMGDWASVRVTCHSKGHDTEDEVTAASIEQINIRITPGKAMKDALTKATLVPVDKIQKKTT